GFNKMLPQSCMFTGCVINRAKDRVGPQHSTFEEAEKYKPDFRNLDRIIKTGSWNRQMPQLVWFIYQNKLNYVQQLLEKGASVNVTSESGETPILMAIQHMDVTSTPFKDPEDRFFNLVAAYEHEPEIINMRTSKKKLLALICAVETGKPQIVSKVLELGAEIDRRGQFEENTALYFCVALVSRVVKPAKIKAIVANLNANPTNMLLDSLQRTEKWGTTLDDTDRILQAQNNDEVFQEIETVVEKLYHEREQLLNPAELRKIAIILLNAGANPNATHFFDYLRGYTPLMFAAENDEVEIFEKMLECDGDPLKTFYSPQDDCQYHCFHVAFKWKSEKVLKILQQKYPRDFDSSMAQISAWRDNLVVRSNSQNSNLTK
ncbi:MAG: ankyrin repeat domain-containing protein, partial [Psychrosphaera sp.]|nr:ankyrin repeat domain-containing protein [Psychrosphaera sp.]